MFDLKTAKKLWSHLKTAKKLWSQKVMFTPLKMISWKKNIIDS